MEAAPTHPATRAVAWVGGLLFLISMLFCGFSFAVAMGRPASGAVAHPVVVNVLLFTSFALHHSVFARAGVRTWVTRHAPAGLERSAYVWAASLWLIAVCWLWQGVPGTAWVAVGPTALVLRAVQGAGVWLTIQSARSIDILELAGIRQLAPAEGPLVFTSTGPYGWVRHPIYTGWFLITLAEPVMTATRLTFAIVSGLYLLIAIPFEERSLLATEGPAYRAYSRAVPWKLCPWIY